MGCQGGKQILGSSKLVALGLLESITALACLCTKYTRKASQKLARVTLFYKQRNKNMFFLPSNCNNNNKKKKKNLGEGEESFGDDGLWRRGILMGDKCEPLEFSGVIYYDCHGNTLDQPPVKSPRVGFAGYPTAQSYY